MTNTRTGYNQRKSNDPPRVRNGIKLKAREGEPEPGNWIARAWRDRMYGRLSRQALDVGLQFAQSGQTIELHCHPSRIDALVQGSAGKPTRVTIRVPVISASHWDKLIHDMADEAVYTVQLMAGQVPESFRDLLNQYALRILPEDPDEITIEGHADAALRDSCAATVAQLMIERLNDDQTLISLLRGMPADRLLDQLRQVRTIRTHGEATAHPQSTISRKEPQPLETCVDSYWRLGSTLHEFENTPHPSHAPHALLRRLGPSPMDGRFPMLGLLASVYDELTQHARAIDEGEQR